MAKKTVTLRVCDLHRGTAEAVQSVRVALDGKTATLDVCDEHLEQVQATFKQWTRRASSRTRRTPRRKAAPANRSATNGNGGPANADVRAWARSQGYAVSNRGRVPSEIVRAYAAAQ